MERDVAVLWRTNQQDVLEEFKTWKMFNSVKIISVKQECHTLLPTYFPRNTPSNCTVHRGKQFTYQVGCWAGRETFVADPDDPLTPAEEVNRTSSISAWTTYLTMFQYNRLTLIFLQGWQAPINTKFPVFSLCSCHFPCFFLLTKNKIFKFVNSLHHPHSHPFLSKWTIKGWIDLLQQPP